VSGFIGANLFFRLSSLRDDVYGASPNVGSSWRLVNSAIGIHRCLPVDITHPNDVNDLISRLKPGTVFNVAAYGGYERQSDVLRIHNVNYLGMLHLIRPLSEHGCDAFVQAGCSSEYGLNCSAPHESDELLPNSHYAVSKAAGSLFIKYYGRIKGFPCVNLRLSSVYGPWEERDRLIPGLLKHVLNGKFPPLVDRNISRDFIYIDDCLRAFVEAALTVCKTEPGLTINIASGIKTSLEEVAGIAGRIFDVKGDPGFGNVENHKWDSCDWSGNPGVALEKMGWQHRISLEEGLRLTGQWEMAATRITRFAPVSEATKRISAIIACYRDHEAIPIMHERLVRVFEAEGVEYEILFVNDHSPTEDEEVICRLCRSDHHVIGVSHSRNFGSQSSFLSGMEIATGDAVVLLDGDLQDPPELISEFLKKWSEGFDVVYGIRRRRVGPLHLQLLYKLFYRAFRHLSDVEIPLDAGDFSLIDRKVVDYIIKFPEKDIFLRGLRAWAGFRQTGVLYVRPERMFGRSTNNFLKNIWWAKKAIFSFSIKPLEYIQRLGAIMFGVSFIMGLYYLGNSLIYPPVSAKGIPTVIILILGLGGIQLLSLSILGDYLGKVLEEVKNRPRYIRSSVMKGNRIIDSPNEIREFIRSARVSARGRRSGRQVVGEECGQNH
jgi:dolichol-phosphate mannosyltransferase